MAEAMQQSGATEGARPGAGLRRSPTLVLAEEIERARLRGEDVLSLSTPTFPPLPLPALPAVGFNRLAPAEGDPELLAAVGGVLFGHWRLAEHRPVITAGAKAGLFSVLASLLPSGSTVLIVAPAWPSYADTARLAGHNPLLFETRSEDGFRIDPDGLRRMADTESAKAVILSNPCNPTGRIHGPDELSAVLDVAERVGALVLLDESFSELVFDAKAWAKAAVAGSAGLVLFNSFSKNYHLQGLRVAACLVNERHVAAVVAAHQTLVSSAPSISQTIALEVVRKASPVARAYDRPRAIAQDIVARAGWDCVPGSGTFYLFPRMNHPGPTHARMREAGLFSLTGDAFGPSYGAHIRLCFGKPEAEMEAIRRRLAAIGLIAGF